MPWTADSLQMIEDLSEERERLLAREGSHHAGASDHRRLGDVDHALGVLWDREVGRRLSRPLRREPGGRCSQRVQVVAFTGER
jgi:hypothetical protein